MRRKIVVIVGLFVLVVSAILGSLIVSVPLVKAATMRPNKYVGILYHTRNDKISRLYGADSYVHPNNPALGAVKWWGKPALGFYYSSNPTVVDTHMQQLTSAGVDFITIDLSNQELNDFDFRDATTKVLQRITARSNSNLAHTKVSFFTRGKSIDYTTGYANEIDWLYRNYYQAGNVNGINPNIFFKYGQKPLLLTDYDVAQNDCAAPVSNGNTSTYFECKRVLAGSHLTGVQTQAWAWIDHYPQSVYNNAVWSGNDWAEEMPVSAAQGHDPGFMSITENDFPTLPQYWAHGRNWKHCTEPNCQAHNNGVQGQNFSDQWSEVNKYNPTIVFVANWNQWHALRYRACVDIPGDGGGLKTDPNYVFSPCNRVNEYVYNDEHSPEYSDDLEPMQGGHGDWYYQKLKTEVQKYKRNAPGFFTYRSDNGTWYLKDGGNNPSQLFAARNYTYNFSWPGSGYGTNYQPFAGDLGSPTAMTPDGLLDVGLRDMGTGTWYFAFNKGDGGFNQNKSFPWAPGSHYQPLTGDFGSAASGIGTGDGIRDIGLRDPNNGAWYFQFGNSTGGYGSQKAWTWDAGTNYQPFVGDFGSTTSGINDGKIDIGLRDVTTGIWRFAFNLGNGSFSATRSYNWPAVGSHYQPFTGNFDCDNATDIGLRDTNSGAIALNNSNGNYTFTHAGGYQWRTGASYTTFVDDGCRR